MKPIAPLLINLSLFIGCTFSTSDTPKATGDSTIMQNHSPAPTESSLDTENDQDQPDSGDYDMLTNTQLIDTQLIDIDRNGTKEKIETYFSGGAHCCFTYIISELRQGEYQTVFEFSGGENSLEIQAPQIILYPFEQIGYFHTCYACEIDAALPYDQHRYPVIYMTYRAGKLHPNQPNPDKLATFNREMEANLAFLKDRGIPALDPRSESDDGTRKMFASLLISFHYFDPVNNDMEASRKLFYKYYDAHDKDTVWSGIRQVIEQIMD